MVHEEDIQSVDLYYPAPRTWFDQLFCRRPTCVRLLLKGPGGVLMSTFMPEVKLYFGREAERCRVALRRRQAEAAELERMASR